MSAPYFERFRDNLSVQNASDISTSYAEITMRLNKDFWSQESDVYHRRQVGSYGRRTAINGISDLDMIFELPWSMYEKYKQYENNGPSQLLQAVRQSLLMRYPKTDIKGDGQVVVIKFTNFVVEVLPAFVDAECDGYRFGDANNGGSWKVCKPIQEMDAIDELNTLTNKNLKHVCKMLRAWKNTHGVSMGGLLIDTLAHNFFLQNSAYNDKSYASYENLFVSIFTYLGGLDHQDFWLAPGSGQRVYGKGKFQSKAKKASAKCQKAVDAESEIKKAKLWREVFGRSFPADVTAVKSESAITLDSSRYTTEEFIEDKFPVDIRYDLTVDSDVSENGKNSGRLRRMSQMFSWLPTGRSLRFHVEYCDVPEPYQLLWKVRNVGLEAERRKQIRGQIISDSGKAERNESTSFSGEHFVEAYAIKDGVCVARDVIDVPISEQ